MCASRFVTEIFGKWIADRLSVNINFPLARVGFSLLLLLLLCCCCCCVYRGAIWSAIKRLVVVDHAAITKFSHKISVIVYAFLVCVERQDWLALNLIIFNLKITLYEQANKTEKGASINNHNIETDHSLILISWICLHLTISAAQR